MNREREGGDCGSVCIRVFPNPLWVIIVGAENKDEVITMFFIHNEKTSIKCKNYKYAEQNNIK